MSTPQALQTFADWVASIRGDENSEAQTYVNRLLQAWGWADAEEAVTTFERKIPKGSLAGGMGKADLGLQAGRAVQPLLNEAVTWLEARVTRRVVCGDHWLVVAEVLAGRMRDPDGATAVP